MAESAGYGAIVFLILVPLLICWYCPLSWASGSLVWSRVCVVTSLSGLFGVVEMISGIERGMNSGGD
jgi:hypothetical protein